MKNSKDKQDTVLTVAGRDPFNNFGVVNPPVYHASTILTKTVAELEAQDRDPFGGVRYGRRGTTTHFALEEAVTRLENGYRTIAMPSGLGAITGALMGYLKSGDHLLMVDTAYAPTRFFCDKMLKGFGVETTYYDPMIGGEIKDLIKPNTKVVFTESPGSVTFEVQDIPAIVEEAHKAGAIVMIDNTWAAGYYFKPLALGVDVSIQAATKYIVGHSDAMLGTITTTEEAYLPIRRATAMVGYAVGPDDVYLGLRGLRTMGARLARHQESALTLANWLKDQPAVARVLHPALPDCPGHDIWKRDFTGSCGLFSIVLNPVSKDKVDRMLDNMEHFALGYSWGGYESLILPMDPSNIRTATRWQAEGPMIRLHIGLEDIDDLIADLDQGLARLKG